MSTKDHDSPAFPLMLALGWAYPRGYGNECFGNYRTIRIGFGPIWISLGWRVSR